jgi:uncharacterized membrane protein
MDITFGDGRESPYFSAILSPHRSLSFKGFKLLMAFFGILSLLIGGWFLMIGAWPVFGFFGLDVLLLYLAFRSNYKWGGVRETVNLTETDLEIVHHPLNGPERSWRFNPYWVQLRLLERRGRSSLLQACSHGRALTFATFLSEDEKKELNHRLGIALHNLKTR